MTGWRPIDAAAGRVTFGLPVTDWLRSIDGRIGPTAATLLADAPIGGACLTALGPGTLIPTAELSFVYVGSGAKLKTLTGVGSLVSADEISVVATVVVGAEEGRTLAIGSTRCVIRYVEPGSLPPPPERDPTDLPDPHLRPVAGRALTPDEVVELTGAESVEAMVAGELPQPPIAHLLGLRPIAAEPGEVSVEMIASGWHESPGGTMYGGSLAAGAEHTLSLAARTAGGRGAGVEVLDLKVNYVRPVFADGTILRFEASLDHQGRRVVVGRVRALRPDGKPVLLASGTALLVPAR